MTPQERQVWRMVFATAIATSLDADAAIRRADNAIALLRTNLQRHPENKMARIAMNVAGARK
jgi:ribosomal protein L31E